MAVALAKLFWKASDRSTSDEKTATHHPQCSPGRILLMRHAEKTRDTSDILLSAEGTECAWRLVTYIPQMFGRPDFIYAAARSKRSIRSIETVTPLAPLLASRSAPYPGQGKPSSPIFFRSLIIAGRRSLSAGITASGRRSQHFWAAARAATRPLAARRFQSDPGFSLRSEIGFGPGRGPNRPAILKRWCEALSTSSTSRQVPGTRPDYAGEP